MPSVKMTLANNTSEYVAPPDTKTIILSPENSSLSCKLSTVSSCPLEVHSSLPPYRLGVGLGYRFPVHNAIRSTCETTSSIILQQTEPQTYFRKDIGALFLSAPVPG